MLYIHAKKPTIQSIVHQHRTISILRLDQIHPKLNGNKYFKLKYNLKLAKEQGYSTLLTFGGAYSNHILATAIAGQLFDFETIGVIRGKEVGQYVKENTTLRTAKEYGMRFHFVSREQYRGKENNEFVTGLREQFGSFYLIPEGGTNDLAVKGCEEIADFTKDYDVISCAVGTGGTLAGIIQGSEPNQTILGFPVLNADLSSTIEQFTTQKKNWQLISDYHFGGYGKVTRELYEFVNEFYRNYQIQLDYIYTGKLMYGLSDLIQRQYFDNSKRILVIHTGGQQGNESIEERFLMQ